jgi:hypothetical protein
VEQSVWFPSGHGRGERPVDLSYLIVSHATQELRAGASVMWAKPFWSLGLCIFEAIMIGFEIGYRQFSVHRDWVAGA